MEEPEFSRAKFLFFADHLNHPSLRQIVAYVMRKTGGRRLPRRSDIDPTEIPTLLPHIALIDVQQSPWQFRFRLIGTHITRALGEDNTGRYFSDLPHGSFMPWLHVMCECCVAERRLQEIQGDIHWAGRRRTQIEAFYLPMSSDGKTVDMICAGADVRRTES